MDEVLEMKGKDSIKRNGGKEIEWSNLSNNITIKVGLIGENQSGKSSFMKKCVEDKYEDDYVETLGVSFMEKTVKLKNITVMLRLWDLGGQQEYQQLMPLVCSDAKVMLFVFDLTQWRSLSGIRRLYKRVMKDNRHAVPFLIGAKFDLFDKKDTRFRKEMTIKARKFAKAMKAPLIYCSSTNLINIKSIFQIIIGIVFRIKPKVAEVKNFTEPIVEYKRIWAKLTKKLVKGKNTEIKKKEVESGETKYLNVFQEIGIGPII